MVKQKRTKRQTMIHKTLQRKLNKREVVLALLINYIKLRLYRSRTLEYQQFCKELTYSITKGCYYIPRHEWEPTDTFSGIRH
jgi:hypothetical protein